MKRFIKKSGAVVLGLAVASLVWTSPAAKAIGPDYQYIPDAQVGGGEGFGALSAPTLNNVIGFSSGGNVFGTGTVIGAASVGTDTYLSVLTALHVAQANPTAVDFGAGFSGSAPAYSQNNAVATAPTNSGFLLQANNSVQYSGAIPKMVTYTLPGQGANPRPEDMAIVQVKIPQQAAGSFAAAELSLVTAPADIPSLSDAFANGGTAGNVAVGFTQFGEGRAGIFSLANWPAGLPATAPALPANPAAGTYSGFNGGLAIPGNTNGYRRFQNNTSSTLAAPAVVNNFYMPLVRYTTTAPGTAGGSVTGMGGTGFAGDSGGPLMTAAAGESVFVTPNLAGTSTNQTLVPVNDTSGEAAVYVGYAVGATRFLSGGTSIVEYKTSGTTTNAAVPLLNSAETNALVPAANQVANGQGSLEWAMEFTSTGLLFGNTPGNIINTVNGAGGGPLAIPEPASLSLLCLGGLSMFRRRGARRVAAGLMAVTGTMLAGAAGAEAYTFPTTGNPTVFNANYNTYVAQQQGQFSAAASVLMTLNATSVNNNPGAAGFPTVQARISTIIANNNGTSPKNVFAADAYGVQAALAQLDNTRAYVAYVSFTQATTNSANLTLAYNITHYNEPGSILATQMNPFTKTTSYSWMDVYGLTSSVQPPVPGSPAPCTINGFFVRDPWVGYWRTASAAVQAITPPGLSTDSFLANNVNGLWSQVFKPYNPPAQAGANITGVPATTFTKGPSINQSTTGRYQFVTDPDEDDTLLDTQDETLSTPALNDSLAVADATNDLSGANDPGADAPLAALPEFEGGSFQTTGDAHIAFPDVPGDSEWVLGYYPAGGGGPTGVVVIDQDTGDLSGAFWNDDDSALSLSTADMELAGDAADYDPTGELPIPEPTAIGVIAMGAIALRKNRSRAKK